MRFQIFHPAGREDTADVNAVACRIGIQIARFIGQHLADIDKRDILLDTHVNDLLIEGCNGIVVDTATAKRVSNQKYSLCEKVIKIDHHIDVEAYGIAYKLVHGAPMDEYMNHPGTPSPIHFAVWKRWRKYDTFSGDFTMIFGHTPTKHYQDDVPMKLWYGNRMIGIDCGSGYPEDSPEGRLACLRLDDGKVYYSEEDNYDH